MSSREEIIIPADILSKLEALPDTDQITQIQIKDWQIEVLRRFWNNKQHLEVSKILGVSTTTALKWYRRFVEGK